jgi:DNA-binding cell septation regulator SpoVG
MNFSFTIEDIISNIEVKPVQNKGNLLALVIITIADAISIDGFLRKGPNGNFLNLPSSKDTKTNKWYTNVRFNHGTDRTILNLVNTVYEKKVQEVSMLNTERQIFFEEDPFFSCS